jgi:hypothetical protein
VRIVAAAVLAAAADAVLVAHNLQKFCAHLATALATALPSGMGERIHACLDWA